MQIVLIKDDEKLGKMGDIINVKVGFARNYLLPKKIAVLPGSQEAREIIAKIATEKQEKQKRVKEKEDKKVQLEEKKKVASAKKAKLLAKK